MVKTVLKMTDVHKTYGHGGGAVNALQGINLEVGERERVAIVGPSGSGKSTLLHIIGLLDSLSDGSYELDGTETKDFSNAKKAYLRNSVFGFVVQDFALVDDYTVKQNVEIPLVYRRPKLDARTRKEKITKVINDLGIGAKLKEKVKNLSGGQRQRVAIARAIVNDPLIILADEPTGALDSKTSREIMDIFNQLNQQGKTIIMVTHNEALAAECDRQVVLADGHIQEGMPRSPLFLERRRRVE